MPTVQFKVTWDPSGDSTIETWLEAALLELGKAVHHGTAIVSHNGYAGCGWQSPAGGHDVIEMDLKLTSKDTHKNEEPPAKRRKQDAAVSSTSVGKN